jgi:hypothetical protein
MGHVVMVRGPRTLRKVHSGSKCESAFKEFTPPAPLPPSPTAKDLYSKSWMENQFVVFEEKH